MLPLACGLCWVGVGLNTENCLKAKVISFQSMFKKDGNMKMLIGATTISVLLAVSTLAFAGGFYIVYNEPGGASGSSGPYESLEACQKALSKKYKIIKTAKCVWQ